MPYFTDADEVYKYLAGVFHKARETEVGPAMAAADLDLQLYYTEPDAKILIKMHGDNIEVLDGQENDEAEIKLFMPADIGDKYWRGDYNLAVGLAKGHVKAKGPTNKILELAAGTKVLFPMYREMVAEKDKAAAV
jgi:putative sterol carrier protein